MRKYSVCVVDDSVEVANILCEGLNLHGYDSIAVHSGAEALKVCAESHIDLVILDVLMPYLDGYEVCRRLKELPETRDIIVIFVTAKGAVEDMKRGYELGAVDYITKPCNLPIVMVRVEAALRNKERADKLRQSQGLVWDPSYTDDLTGLRNGRFLLERLQEEVDKAHRYDYPVSCVVFDVDEVKAVDEELGPVSMDDLLVEIAMMLRDHSRTYDVVARYDGAVFAAVLPHAPLDDAVGYAKKIMGAVEATTFSDPNFPTQASLSTGIIACQNGTALGADYVLGEAMGGLLRAKSLRTDRLVGRNLSEP